MQEQEESGILLKTSDSDTNTDNQESRGQSLDEISKKTLNKKTRTRKNGRLWGIQNGSLWWAGWFDNVDRVNGRIWRNVGYWAFLKTYGILQMRTGRWNRKRGGSGALYVSKRRELSFIYRQLGSYISRRRLDKNSDPSHLNLSLDILYFRF